MHSYILTDILIDIYIDRDIKADTETGKRIDRHT